VRGCHSDGGQVTKSKTPAIADRGCPPYAEACALSDGLQWG
jgi:hypothetical protein